MKVGIVGLPNAGKSTLFSALTGVQAQAANYPFTTIDPNVAIVPVPDERLDAVAATLGSTPITYETIEFHDIAGLVAGLVMAFLVAGLVAGWPLLHAAMAAGADDALDALSRTFSYLIQRLGLFLAGLALAWLAGIGGLFVMDLLARGVIDLTHWSLALSAPGALTAELFSEAGRRGGPMAAATHRFWLGAVRLLAAGWAFSFFWTAAAGLYLWLRHEVDGTPWADVDLPAVIPGAGSDRA